MTPGEPRRVVDLVLEDPRWDEAGIASVAERAAGEALAAAGLGPEGFEVSLLAADDARIAGLNRTYRGEEGPTNVLSWPAFPGDSPEAVAAEMAAEGAPVGEAVLLGDVALAYETCAAEAAAEGKTLADHLAHLVAHGVLHLLGHDHGDPAAAERMEGLERKALASMGVSDPYRTD